MSGAPGKARRRRGSQLVRKSRAASSASASVHPVPPASASVTDEQMVREILDGNAQMFENLVRRHQRQIVNFLYRMVGDFDLALDMSQDVFIRVYQALDRFDPRYRFTTWI